MEEWREVPGFEAYSVSSLGRVMRNAPGKSTTAGRILSAKARRRDGYRPVVLSLGARGKNRQALVHHLVAEAFHGPKPTPEHCVAHNDGDPTNNRADNLRWATHAENMHDMSHEVHGRSTHGERCPWAVLTEEQVIALRVARVAKPYGGVTALARQWGVRPKTANDAARGTTWKHLENSNGV